MSTKHTPPPVVITDDGSNFDLCSYDGPVALRILSQDVMGNEQALANAEFAAKAYNHHDELLTRLYTLKNAVGNLIHDLNDDIPEDHDIRFFYKEAQETIKRVKPEGFTIEEDAKAMNIKKVIQ